MSAPEGNAAAPVVRTSPLRRLLKVGCWGCGGTLLLFALLIWGLFLFLDRVPRSYPPSVDPMDPPAGGAYASYGLDGFESPYLGHTGSWDGQGGGMLGSSKVGDLDAEVGMGLRWTFMPVHWSALEPGGPVELKRSVPPAWKELDGFVVEAQKRRLNVLMQVTIGGNAGGPPAWAGRREPGKSAPGDMEAAASFAAKLAVRYRPGGTLASERGWGEAYGVRAWELDNEPNVYFTHWGGQAGDYAEFVTRAAARIKAEDPRALLLLPATTGGADSPPWIEAALDAQALNGSPAYRQRGLRHSIGPVTGGVSFHSYEGLDSAFSGDSRTIERVLDDTRAAFEAWESRAEGFHFERKREYWHTEGNFDFLGALSAGRRAAWRIQFFTRAFAAGIRKVCVMDASVREQAAVRGYVGALPWPFPMRPADSEVRPLRGHLRAFRHTDAGGTDAGQVWVLWAVAGAGPARAEVPALRARVTLVHVDGTKSEASARGGRITVELEGDAKMAPPVLVVDRPTQAGMAR